MGSVERGLDAGDISNLVLLCEKQSAKFEFYLSHSA